MQQSERLEKRVVEDIAVYYLEGDIEVFRAEAIRDVLLEDIRTGAHRRIAFNFRKVRSVDSTGIGLFVNLQFSLNRDVAFRFCEMEPNIRQVFEYTNLLSYFSIDGDEQACIAALKQAEEVDAGP